MTKNGFTLLELLFVISIIAILATMGTLGYSSYSARARDARRKIDMQEIRSALELYRSNNPDGVYPTTSEYGSGASSVLVPTYLQKINPDPKGTAYQYSAMPSGCNNAANPCTSYSLSITLEITHAAYTVYPNSMN